MGQHHDTDGDGRADRDDASGDNALTEQGVCRALAPSERQHAATATEPNHIGDAGAFDGDDDEGRLS